MGFVAPIVSGVTGLISAIGARKNAKAAGQQSALMGQAQQQQMGSLGQSRAAGTSMLNMGTPATQNSLNYYSTLLRGNRAQMSQAIAGPAAQITDNYRGANMALEHMGVRGGEAATARAEMARDQAGKIAGLTTGLQPMAAAQLGSMGTGLMTGGTSALLNSASGYGSLAGQAGGMATQYGQQEREDLQGVGKSVGEVLKWWKDRKPAGTPSYNPNWTMAQPDYANPSDAGGYG